MALVLWHSTLLTVGRQGSIAQHQLLIHDPPGSETCIGDAPNKNLSGVSQGEYSQHKASVALLGCDERALRVFTDANFKVSPVDSQKIRPRPVGALYVGAETIKNLQYWIKTHPNKAEEILRYINTYVHLLRSSIIEHISIKYIMSLFSFCKESTK